MSNLVPLYALVSVTIVSLISLVGVLTLSIKHKVLTQILTYILSFTAGAMLGDVFIHILPEVVEELEFSATVSLLILSGIVVTFLIEKIIHWKHADLVRQGRKNVPHPVTILTLFGDGIHNFVDGVTIGATYLISVPAGIATTVAVILHEIPQEIGNFGVLIHGGLSRTKALFYNLLSALTAVAGTFIVLYAGQQFETTGIYLSAFTAGTFIYIAGSDLIPELHGEGNLRKNLLQLVIFILGIAVMWALLALE